MNSCPLTLICERAFRENVYAGVIGNGLFFLLLVAIGLLVAILPSRRKLRALFSPSGHDLDAITVVTSAIRIPAPHNAMGVHGGAGPYPNVATPALESAAAHVFKSALPLAFPSWVGLPGPLRGISILSTPIEVIPSPLNTVGIPMSGCLVCVGGPFFNAASNWAEQLPGNMILSRGAPTVGGTPLSNASQCAISRTLDTANNRFVFYIVGLSEEASSAGLIYLARNWRKIAGRYKADRNFHFTVEWTGPKTPPRVVNWGP